MGISMVVDVFVDLCMYLCISLHIVIGSEGRR